jgi:hypothetical protein
MATPPRKSTSKIKLAVTWGKQQIVHPSYQTYDTRWLREISLRQLLAHVVNKVNPLLYSLDNAESIAVSLVEHIDEVTSSGGKRKRILGRTCATDLLDEGVYEIMHDCSTREFIFHVSPVEVREGDPEVVNAFSILRNAQTLGTELPPPRVTRDNTADDNLHNDVLRWLEQKGVGFTRADVQTIGKDFVNSITTALFPLTSGIFDAMSDPHNAGI